MINGIRHIGITVTDMEEALRFYRDLLGLKVILDRKQEGEVLERILGIPYARMRAVMLKAPDGKCVELFKFYSHPAKAPDRIEVTNVGCTHVAFCVNDLAELCTRLRAAGVRFHCPPVTGPSSYAKVTYCRDFDGTIVELVEILDEAKSPYANRP